MDKKFFSTTEIAKILGISRVAVFKKIKKGEIRATKVGRNFIINKKDLGDVFGTVLSPENKKIIDRAVSRTAEEYGETLRLLGNE
jgi:putative molybdopterin biosynthesis protein